MYNFYICCSLGRLSLYNCNFYVGVFKYNLYCGKYILSSSVDSQCTNNTPLISVSVSQARASTHPIRVSVSQARATG